MYTNLIAKTVKVGILVTQKKGKATNAILMHLQQHNNYWIKWQDVSYMDSKEDWKQNYINAIDQKVSMSPLKKTATRPSFENRRNFWWRHHCNFNSLFANQMSDFHRLLTQANNLLSLQETRNHFKMCMCMIFLLRESFMFGWMGGLKYLIEISCLINTVLK